MKEKDKIKIMLSLILLFTIISLPEIPVPKVREIVDERFLSRMLENGSVVIIHKKSSPESPQFVSAGALINAPLERVWNIITDYENYPNFVPQVEMVKIKSRDGNDLVLEYTLSFRFTVIKMKVRYTLLTRLRPPHDIWWTLKKDEKNDIEEAMGRWELIPLEENKTAAFYTIYSHLQSYGRLMRFFLKQEPHLELAIPVSTGTLIIDAVKRKAEERGE